MALFTVGAVLAIAGMIFDNAWVINAGIFVLVLGFGLRLLGDRRRFQTDDGADDGS
jgi:hypothetical protein